MRLHHIGHLVHDLSAAAAACQANFGYRIESPVIEDPVQTALVQFLRLPGGANWLELVTPNGPNSKLSLALAKGGGLHHLCYEVDDIEAACVALRRQKMALLSTPAPAVAFTGRRIAWLLGRDRLLTELVESGPGPLNLAVLAAGPPRC